jgi:hypothetical protein
MAKYLSSSTFVFDERSATTDYLYKTEFLAARRRIWNESELPNNAIDCSCIFVLTHLARAAAAATAAAATAAAAAGRHRSNNDKVRKRPKSTIGRVREKNKDKTEKWTRIRRYKCGRECLPLLLI